MKKVAFNILLSAMLTCTVLMASSQSLPDTAAKTNVISPRQLRQVTVTSVSRLQPIRQQPQTVSVIDLRPYYNRPQGAADLVNQTAGVKVRQGGGLGSYADYYINGLSGRQVKIFIDGIPLDYLGAALNLNILPVNMIDRIEIYKGVVPVQLGTDALGGAINIVTRKSAADYLDASLSQGSFHTTLANLNLRKNIDSLLFIETTAFYNYSQNDYPIDVMVPNTYGNPVPTRLREFHNSFDNYYTGITLGLRPGIWADELRLFSSLSGLAQQIPNNLDMTQPYGKVTNALTSWNSALKFTKKILYDRLSIAAYVGINQTRDHFIDTSLNSYTWDGKVAARRTSGGESYGPVQDIHTKMTNQLARLNLSYQLSKTTLLSANSIGSYYTQKDDYPPTAPYPVRLQKLTAGLALEQSLAHDRLKSITSIKFYSYIDKGYTITTTNQIAGAHISKQKAGWNEALRWKPVSFLLLKTSYEYAIRLPEEDELFGTYIQRTHPNPGLQPEISHNLNGGLQAAVTGWRFETNAFYRRASNLIYAPPTPYFLVYQNLLKAQITGIEGEIIRQLTADLRITVNATWQNIRNKTAADHSGNETNSHYNQRLPNIPFLFGNGELHYTKPIRNNCRLSAWYNATYVHWFYLYWEGDGLAETKARIPGQFVQNAGLSYAIENDRYGLSAELRNIADKRVYDNYGVQRPGRSVTIKLRLSLQKI